MAGVTRVGDSCTGHDSCGPTPLVTGSESVRANGRGVGRLGDRYASHGCRVHGTHQDEIAGASSTVRANGRFLARSGDAVSIGGNVAAGSQNVRAN